MRTWSSVEIEVVDIVSYHRRNRSARIGAQYKKQRTAEDHGAQKQTKAKAYVCVHAGIAPGQKSEGSNKMVRGRGAEWQGETQAWHTALGSSWHVMRHRSAARTLRSSSGASRARSRSHIFLYKYLNTVPDCENATFNVPKAFSNAERIAAEPDPDRR